jgi:hypothetical protein
MREGIASLTMIFGPLDPGSYLSGVHGSDSDATLRAEVQGRGPAKIFRLLVGYFGVFPLRRARRRSASLIRGKVLPPMFDEEGSPELSGSSISTHGIFLAT